VKTIISEILLKIMEIMDQMFMRVLAEKGLLSTNLQTNMRFNLLHWIPIMVWLRLKSLMKNKIKNRKKKQDHKFLIKKH